MSQVHRSVFLITLCTRPFAGELLARGEGIWSARSSQPNEKQPSTLASFHVGLKTKRRFTCPTHHYVAFLEKSKINVDEERIVGTYSFRRRCAFLVEQSSLTWETTKTNYIKRHEAKVAHRPPNVPQRPQIRQCMHGMHRMHVYSY